MQFLEDLSQSEERNWFSTREDISPQRNPRLHFGEKLNGAEGGTVTDIHEREIN